MSIEAEFDKYFQAYGWNAKPMTDVGWTWHRDGFPGFLQVDGHGSWWHVVDGKTAKLEPVSRPLYPVAKPYGSGLDSLKEYLAYRGLDDRVRWAGKEQVLEPSHGR
jgi:hypothetical protein